MAGRSSIEKLPKELLDAVHGAIRDGMVIDEIVDLLKERGAERSRSAVGRYTKTYRQMADRQRDISSVAVAFASEFGDADNSQQKLLLQLLTNVLTTTLLPMASDGEIKTEPKDLHYLARSIKDAVSSAEIDTRREAKIREEERKTSLADAARVAEQAARGSGATPETIAAIKRELLGID